MREMGTGELVEAACGGDQAAWDVLVERYSRLVWAITRSFRLSTADAADVFQTVWLRLAEHICRLREPERAGAWLATTARNECLRLVRAATRVVVTEDLDDLSEGPEAFEDELPRAEQRAALVAAFALLPERDQQLLAMIVDPDCSYDDICRDLDMPRGSIGPTRKRSLDRLYRHYRDLYDDDMRPKEGKGR